jgi:hypothetical protein
MAMSSSKTKSTQVNNRRVSFLFPIPAQHWELPSRMASIVRFFLFLGVLSRFPWSGYAGSSAWCGWMSQTEQSRRYSVQVTPLFRFLWGDPDRRTWAHVKTRMGWGGNNKTALNYSRRLCIIQTHYSNTSSHNRCSVPMRDGATQLLRCCPRWIEKEWGANGGEWLGIQKRGWFRI